MAERTTASKKRPEPKKRTTKIQLARQQVQKPVSQPLLAARAEIQLQLHDTIIACEELFKSHGQACTCDCCSLVSNFVGAIRLFHMLLEIT
jgi:tRNA1(Val) A37 N6-methylase TrmN6